LQEFAKKAEERIHYGTVKGFFLSGMVWFILGTSFGFIDATHMSAPELLSNIPWLVFGRIRPMHTNAVIFGFIGTTLMGAMHYILPTLMRVPLYSENLGRLSLVLWNVSIAVGEILLALGYSQGREYAEWVWIVDIGILATLLIIFYNFYQTAARREEPILYVSNWYFYAGLFYFFFIYFFGNAVWNPQTGSITGMPDSILAWFYGHGLVGFFLTPLAVGAAYYIIPIVSRAPLYSHTLSLVGFWSILLFYNHIGAHHILQAPTPTWLKVVAITGSLAMIMPVATALTNLWLTMRGRLAYLHTDIGGKFIFAGLVWYLLTCIQGPLQALPLIQRVTHLNNWVIAHAHLGVLGFSGTIALGAMYFIIPRITGRPLYNSRLADVQYWLVLLGMAGFFTVLTAAGLFQGHSWYNGESEYRVLPQLHIYFLLRQSIGLLLVSAAFIGFYNVYMSFYSRKRVHYHADDI
jgi:cytochrome c oxidase cbb3-type subunit I